MFNCNLDRPRFHFSEWRGKRDLGRVATNADANKAVEICLPGSVKQPSQDSLEIIDVFVQPRRAITDGIIVTPTLIGSNKTKLFVPMGDLADRAQVEMMLNDLWMEDAASRST